jgi:hypothetical protein
VTRGLVGLFVVVGCYTGLGLVLLRASGLRRPGPVGTAGLALSLGWAAFAVVGSLAIVVGLPLGAREIASLCAVTAAAALLATRKWPLRDVSPTPIPVEGWRRFVGDGAATLLAAWLGLLVVRSLFAVADRNWDSWAFWLPKAKAIHYFDGLETGPGGFASFANPEYPPGRPVLDAATYAFAGGVEAWPTGVQHAIAGAAFFVAAGALLGRRVAGWILWPCLLALALAPDLAVGFDASLADLTVAYPLGLGGICGALWLLQGAAPLLVLAGVFLAAASLTKSEGFALSLALAASLAVAAAFARRPLRPILALAAVPVAALTGWKLWLAAHGQPQESALFSTSDLFRPGLLLDRLDRLNYAAREVIGLVLDPGRWLLVAPLAVASALATLLRHAALGVFVLTWEAIAFLALVSVYWISNQDVVWHVETSAARVAASLVVFAGVLFPLLLAELERPNDQ